MTVLKSGGNEVMLEGVCSSEDAESLLQQLSGNSTVTVDLRSCESTHTAVVQVLLASNAAVLGPPSKDTPLRRWIYPALISHKQIKA